MAGDPLVAVPESVWKPTVKRAKILAQLAAKEHCSKEHIAEAAKKLKIGRAMVYRLLARFRLSEQATSLLPTKPGRKPGSKELAVEQEKIVDKLIREFYLSRQKPTVTALHRTIALECFQADVPTPSYKAVRTPVRALAARDTLRAREGAKAAADRFRPIRASLSASEPLELVQIDHTLVDVIVVDDLHRKPIGRPWLSLAIDVATRNVLGFFLSLRAPSAAAVALTISRAVLPKTTYLAGLQVDAEWPACGIPRSLHLDNAKEFRGRALRRGCEQHGIQIIYRPPLQPHFGGHIERLIGTLMGEVHLLPGTTFSSVAKRGNYDSEGQATMTLAELEPWLALQIAGVYHLRPHSALRCTPSAAWMAGLGRMGKPLPKPADPKRFYLDFLPFEQRTVGRAGLRLFNILYWHGALGAYVHDGKKHVVRYDPRDLSRVHLLEAGGSYLEIPYRDLFHAPVSLDQVQNGARQLRAQGTSPSDEPKLFQAILKQREIIESSSSKTLKARRKTQQLQKRKPASDPSAAQRQPELNSEPETPVDPFPFEIWHE
jgi:putative transposase